MNRILFSAILVFSFVSVFTGCSKPRDPTKEFQGVWEVTITSAGGTKVVKEAAFDKDSCKISDKASADPKEGVSAKLAGADIATIQVDPTKTPGVIDFVSGYGEDQGKTRQGIFSFDGGKLKICLGKFGAPRPTDFVPSENASLMEFERK